MTYAEIRLMIPTFLRVRLRSRIAHPRARGTYLGIKRLGKCPQLLFILTQDFFGSAPLNEVAGLPNIQIQHSQLLIILGVERVEQEHNEGR